MSSERELVTKIDALIRKRYGNATSGAQQRLFNSFDKDSDGKISSDELSKLLEAADVGNRFTRAGTIDTEEVDLELERALFTGPTISSDESDRSMLSTRPVDDSIEDVRTANRPSSLSSELEIGIAVVAKGRLPREIDTLPEAHRFDGRPTGL